MAETIMVVDDEEKIRQSLRGVLTDEGFDVVEAEDGRAALDLLSRGVPRLAIVDIWMPEVDGIELVQRMRTEAPEVPIIVMSGHGTIETAVRVIRMGAFDFLEKPFKLDALLQTVGRALGGAASESAPDVARAPSIQLRSGVAPPRRFRQRTIGRSVVVNGQGLHSGVQTGLVLQPLPPGSGIVFGNIATGDTVPALIDYVASTGYATSLVRGDMAAKTIEHLMAGLHAYGVTNLLVKMMTEVPILDGSAEDICSLLEDGGVVEQDAWIEELVIDRPIEVGDPGRKSLRIEPADAFEVTYRLEYPEPVGRQELTFRLTDAASFRREIAPARTFGFVKEIETLEQFGLARGGRLHNFILVGDEGVVNAPLRFPDEFVRHKILDVLGDFYLLGRPIRGRVVAHKTGHADNIALLRRLREGLGEDGVES